MLNAWRECRNFWEDSLIGWTGHDLLRVSFGPCVKSDDGYAGAEVLDEVPACASNGEEIAFVGGDVEDVKGGVVLEEEVPVDGNAADVLEHVRELHILWVGPKPIEAVTRPIS